tara:strand:+ start:1559 stop:1774 length:216 start_codon:yes stop_codon:yes gene_type:complete
MNMDKRKLQILMDLVEEERGRDINQRWDDELYALNQYLLKHWHLNRFGGALMGDYEEEDKPNVNFSLIPKK